MFVRHGFADSPRTKPGATALPGLPGRHASFMQGTVIAITPGIARSYDRMRVFSGSKSGVAPATATRTGYCSPRYSTSSSLPSTACSGGR